MSEVTIQGSKVTINIVDGSIKKEQEEITVLDKEQEVIKTTDEKIEELQEENIELINSILDLDFRVFDIESSIGMPMSFKAKKGMRSMARSPYEMMKIVILNNDYERRVIETRAKKYMEGGRMTQKEYEEIISLMDANEILG
ncbi:hypothetical protein QJR26_07160 [Clostridium baratii]